MTSYFSPTTSGYRTHPYAVQPFGHGLYSSAKQNLKRSDELTKSSKPTFQDIQFAGRMDTLRAVISTPLILGALLAGGMGAAATQLVPAAVANAQAGQVDARNAVNLSYDELENFVKDRSKPVTLEVNPPNSAQADDFKTEWEIFNEITRQVLVGRPELSDLLKKLPRGGIRIILDEAKTIDDAPDLGITFDDLKDPGIQIAVGDTFGPDRTVKDKVTVKALSRIFPALITLMLDRMDVQGASVSLVNMDGFLPGMTGDEKALFNKWYEDKKLITPKEKSAELALTVADFFTSPDFLIQKVPDDIYKFFLDYFNVKESTSYYQWAGFTQEEENSLETERQRLLKLPDDTFKSIQGGFDKKTLKSPESFIKEIRKAFQNDPVNLFDLSPNSFEILNRQNMPDDSSSRDISADYVDLTGLPVWTIDRDTVPKRYDNKEIENRETQLSQDLDQKKIIYVQADTRAFVWEKLDKTLPLILIGVGFIVIVGLNPVWRKKGRQGIQK